MAYDFQHDHQHRDSGRQDQGKNLQLHRKPALLHQAATVYPGLQYYDRLDQASEASHRNQIIHTNHYHLE